MQSEIIKKNLKITSFYIKKIFCFKNLILFILSFLILLTFYFNISTLATFADKNDSKFMLKHDKWSYMLLLLNIWFTLFFTYIYSFLQKIDLFKEKRILKNILIFSIFIIFQLIIISSLLITFIDYYADEHFKSLLLLWIFSVLFIASSLLLISFFKFKEIKIYYMIIAILIMIGFIFMIYILCTYPATSEKEFINSEKNMIITISSIILLFLILKGCFAFNKTRNK